MKIKEKLHFKSGLTSRMSGNPKPAMLFLFLVHFLIFSLQSNPASSEARYHGRFMTGGYAAFERFKGETDGGKDNDVAVISTRLFTEFSEISSSRFRLISDLRDKHDFFDKLDRERLSLESDNTLQVRQLVLKSPSDRNGLYGSLGRFSVIQAGSAFTDGAEVGLRTSEKFKMGGFGGFNPKKQERTDLKFDKESKVYGIYTLYESKHRDWYRHFSLSNSLVQNTYAGDLDRFYWFSSSVMQFDSKNRLMILSYFDFVPRTYFQHLLATYSYQFNKIWKTRISASAIDVIEYTRRQGVRERLTPSPYREARFRLQQKKSKNLTFDYRVSHGQRETDDLSKTEFSLGAILPEYFGKRWNLSIHSTYRNNFTSDDILLRGSIGYFSRLWEITLEQEVGIEKYKSSNDTHPTITDLSFAHIFSRRVFSVLSVQYARDESVNILSSFLRIGYRFGNQGIAPLRDGSPARERL